MRLVITFDSRPLQGRRDGWPTPSPVRLIPCRHRRNSLGEIDRPTLQCSGFISFHSISGGSEMRLLIGATVVAATFVIGVFLPVGRASAAPEQVRPASVEHSHAGTATDVSARHRYHHRYHRYGYSRATLPYDGYRPYPPPSPCYGSCRSAWVLPYFGRGW